MVSSPLTAALLGDSNQNLAINDPQLAALSRKMRLGEAMAASGLDSSPAYPMQALGRLAQAIVGGVMMDRGYGDLEALGKQRQEDSTNWMKYLNEGGTAPGTQAPAAPAESPKPAAQPISGGGAPVTDAPDVLPLIKTAAQQHGVPEPLVTALFQQESSLGKNPAAAGNIGQVISSTAANPGYGMQPISHDDLLKPDKNVDFSVAYLRHAGDAAGVKDWNNPSEWAKALKAYNGGGDPNYVQNVARYLPAGVQMADAGNVATDGTPAPAMPATGANAPGVKAALDMMSRAQAAAVYATQHNNPALLEAAKLQMQRAQTLMGLDTFQNLPGGGQVNARTGEIKYPPVGKLTTDESGNTLYVGSDGKPRVVSPFDPAGARTKTEATSPGLLPLDEVRQAQEIAKANAGRPSVEQKVYGEGAGKVMENVANAWKDQQAAVQNANKMDARLNMFEQAMPAFDTGVDSGLRLKGQQALTALGFKTNASAGELMQSLQRQIELANTPKGQGQITENERVLIREANNLIGSTPEGAKMLLAATRSVNDYERKLGAIYTQSAKAHGGVPDPIEVSEAIQNLAPALPPQVEMQLEALKAQKDAAKGGGTPSAGAPAGSTSDQKPPMEGAKQAPDGNWYLPDPKRPGKYLQVQ